MRAYAVDVKRRVFRRRADDRGTRRPLGPGVGRGMDARNLDDLVRCNVDARGFQVQEENDRRPIEMLDALGHKRPRVEPAEGPAEA